MEFSKWQSAQPLYVTVKHWQVLALVHCSTEAALARLQEQKTPFNLHLFSPHRRSPSYWTLFTRPSPALSSLHTFSVTLSRYPYGSNFVCCRAWGPHQSQRLSACGRKELWPFWMQDAKLPTTMWGAGVRSQTVWRASILRQLPVVACMSVHMCVLRGSACCDWRHCASATERRLCSHSPGLSGLETQQLYCVCARCCVGLYVWTCALVSSADACVLVGDVSEWVNRGLDVSLASA